MQMHRVPCARQEKLRMFDRIVYQGLTLLVVGLISAGLGGGLYFFFLGWNQCLIGQWSGAGTNFAVASAMMLVVWWLCCNREDLADR